MDKGKEAAGPELPPEVRSAAEAASKEGVPALFWDPAVDGVDGVDADELAALEALQAECTPVERAEEFKRQGNARLKHATAYQRRQAALCYTRGLEAAAEDPSAEGDAARAVLHSNRAHAMLLLGNHGHALADASAAFALDPRSVKAAYRAAKAAAELAGKAEVALRFAHAGLALEPGNRELAALRQRAEAQLEVARRRDATDKRERERARELAALLRDGRGVTLGRPLFDSRGEHRPRLDDDGLLVWRVLVLYGEEMQSDVIEAFCEADSLDDHLDAMFPPGEAPLPWDERGVYTRDALEFYYQEDAVAPLDEGEIEDWLVTGELDGLEEAQADAVQRSWRKEKWVRCDTSLALGQLLARPGHVVPGHPVFYCVARGTEFRKDFLSGNWSPA